MQQVREDFDRLALLMAHEPDAQLAYTTRLLHLVPSDCDHLLEIGCGFGTFARLVAHRARSVTAIDVSPQMITVAQARSLNYSNLKFVLADFLQAHFPAESCDCIVTMTTLHHMPAEEALRKMKSLLRPGGLLILHDMLGSSGHIDRAFDLVRMPINMALRFWHTGRFRPRREVRRAWDEHGKHETYLTPHEVRALRDEYFPGGRVHRHLLWRYTIVWRKPDMARTRAAH